jgi:uncharacterized protein YneF (UPF0154 family)
MFAWIGWIVLVVIFCLLVGFFIGIIISAKGIAHNATKKLSEDEMARFCVLLEKIK